MPRRWEEASVQLTLHRCSTTIVLVDGSRKPHDVLADLQKCVARDGTAETDVLAVGQIGIATAMVAVASLRSGEDLRPTFSISTMTADEVQEHAPRADFTVKAQTSYRLLLSPTQAWEAPSVWRHRALGDTKLLVGNDTKVILLAKSIAARAKALDAGKALAVETPLLGQTSRVRLRIARLAHAVARAHFWQVAPVDASRPVRTFRCAVIFSDGDGSGEGVQVYDGGRFMFVEVIPDGPAGGFLIGSGLS